MLEEVHEGSCGHHPGEKGVSIENLTGWILLVHDDKRCCGICKEVPEVPTAC